SRRREYERMPVGRRPRHRFHADVAAGSATILDYELLPEALGKLLRQRPCDLAAPTARWRRYYDAHRLDWIRLCSCIRGAEAGKDNQGDDRTAKTPRLPTIPDWESAIFSLVQFRMCPSRVAIHRHRRCRHFAWILSAETRQKVRK